MNGSKLVLHILVTGIVLGVLGDALLRAEPWALNLTLWTLAVTAAALGLAFYHRVEWPRGTAWFSTPAKRLKAFPTCCGLFCCSIKNHRERNDQAESQGRS